MPIVQSLAVQAQLGQVIEFCAAEVAELAELGEEDELVVACSG